MKSNVWIRLSLVTTLVLTAAPFAVAVPSLINHQGRVTDGAGTPATGLHTLVFTLYNQAVGGSSLWTESHSVNLVNGLYTVSLGEVTPIDETLIDGTDRWLGVKIDTDPELTPRTRLVSVPHAIRAGTADVGGGWVDDGGVVRLIDGSALVGIGTGSPQGALHVSNVDSGGVSLNVNDLLVVTPDTPFVGIGRTSRMITQERFGVHSSVPGFGGMVVSTDGAADQPFYGYGTGGNLSAWHAFEGTSKSWALFSAGAFRLVIDSVGHTGIGDDAPAVMLDVKSPASDLFLARFEGSHPNATSIEMNNTTSATTWETAVAGSSGAFGGLVPSGSMYFYRQGSPRPLLSLRENEQVIVGSDAFNSGARLHVYDVSDNGTAVAGLALGTGVSIGVLGNGGTESGSIGVRGVASGAGRAGDFQGGYMGAYFSGSRFAVQASAITAAAGASSVAVDATANNTGGETSYGVLASANGTSSNIGVFSSASGGTSNYAGVFSGDVDIIGTLSKSAGAFRIDHPLDPAHKYLQHSFVESPEMKNVYDGNVVTDATGRADVQLPSWFEALNENFRYQLTVIGDFAQAVIAEEVSDNRFAIRTDRPNVKVSWQVTGIRRDAYARAHPIEVELAKRNEDRGKYLHPELHGASPAERVGYLKAPSRGGEPAAVGRSGAGE